MRNWSVHLAWIGQDLAGGTRGLLRRPGFALLAAGTLAVGLTASTAVFTYINAYARPVPGADADNLQEVWFATEDEPWGALSYPDFEDLAETDGSRFLVTGVGRGGFLATVRRGTVTTVSRGETVAGGFFSVMGIEMSAGRGFSEEEDIPGADPVTVLSHDYWVSRHGADPDVLGETILLNNEPYTIVGITGPGFLGSSAAFRPQFWIPFEQFLRVYRAPDTRVNREIGVVIPVIRLRQGVSATSAGAELEALAHSLDREAPLTDRTRRFVLEELTWISPVARAAESSTTRIMMAAAGFLLLLACANVANLVLSSGARRHSEMAIRGALGATRARLARQLLTENLLLSVPAGVVALALAGPLSARLSSYFAAPSVWGTNVPRDIEVDPRVMLFALFAAVATSAATGLVPALRVSVHNPAEAIGTRGSGLFAGRSRGRLPGARDLLVALQIGIGVVLVFVSALVLRTLESAQKMDPGFDTQQTLASYVSTSSMGVPIPERHRFFEELIRRFEALPWVEAATVAENAPLSYHPEEVLIPQSGVSSISATVARVWPGHFEIMGMRLLEGRPLLDTDTLEAKDVVVVNRTLARRLSPDGNAIGQTLVWPGDDDQPDRIFEVVGIVRDASQRALLDEPGPVAYFSLPQHYSRPGNALLLKVRGDPAAAVDLVERELHAVDTRLAIVNILPYREVVRGALYSQRMNAELFTVIAALGLLLCAAGIYAVLALAVAARKHEIGIRLAVGADRIAIARSVLAPIGGSVLVGLGIGLAGAFGTTRLIGSLLWGVAPADPLSLGAGVGVLLIAVILAVAVPLRGALEIDPVGLLRAE